MDSVEMTGKSVEEAVSRAIAELGCERDEAEVDILEVGAKGILGFGSKPAKVSVKIKYNPENIAKKFLGDITRQMGIDVEIVTTFKEKQLYIDLIGKDIGVLIGKRGQTLDSLQYLTNLVVNKGEFPYTSVTLDTENYRQRRKETLESLALNLAKKAKAIRKNIVLEPMNPYERRIIHSFLQTDRNVSTYSEGEEPFRYVVIAPAKGRSSSGYSKDYSGTHSRKNSSGMKE